MYTDLSAVGWDPTIARVEENGETQYDIQVHDFVTHQVVTYRTVDLISHLSADEILGRGTRVWTAHLQGKPDLVVIKDCWVDSNRMREGQILREVHAEGRKHGRESVTFKTLEKHLPTIITHGDVLISGTPDETRSLPQSMIGGNAEEDEIQLHQELSLSRDAVQDTPTSQYSMSSYIDQFPGRPLRQGPTRTHYRSVIKEVEHSLNEERSLAVAFRAIQGITECKWSPITICT